MPPFHIKMIPSKVAKSFVGCMSNGHLGALGTRYLDQQRSYSKEVHDHFFNPRNAGSFDMNDPANKDKVGTAIVGKAACGDVIKLQVKVEDGKITDARFKTFGCGSAIASSSYATELIKGKTTEEALKLRNTDIASHLNLPPVKIHCSLLAEDAVKLAISNYNSKKPKVKEFEH